MQEPAPSHAPGAPHTPLPDAAHSASGSVPAAIGPQTPSAPPPFLAALADWHSPVHAVFEQTPSTQKFDWHWFGVEHALPCGSNGAWHAPLVQTPDWQSPLTAHCWPTEHAAQAPPQSTPVSVPFLIKSAQVADWQTPPTQLLDWQSALPKQP